MTRKNFEIWAGLSIIVFLIIKAFGQSTMDAISMAVSLAAFLDVAYDKLLWRINPFEQTPRLYGTYAAGNVSTYNGETKYSSIVTIKQTLSSITVYEELDDGYCESVAASLSRHVPHGKWFLYYTYLTHPHFPKKNTTGDDTAGDDIHYGSAVLYVKNRDHIKGSYFTNRLHQTVGSVNMTRIK